MSKKVSIKASARDAKREDANNRKAWIKSQKMADSFQNFAALLGMGTPNLMAQSTYGFNPITRIRTLLEWIHRGSWLGGVAVDLIADDMTREGCSITGDMKPEDMAKIEELIDALNIWSEISDVIRWSRLYGGALGVYMVEGQKFNTPLRLDSIRWARANLRALWYGTGGWLIRPWETWYKN
jgi:hypothetical protein